MIRRREFMALLSGAATWPMAARAQQTAIPAIGLLDPRSLEGVASRLRGFRQGLQENGYIEGDNIRIIYRWGENQFDRLPELAEDLVRRQVAVIATSGSDHAATAAKSATTTIPIVSIFSQDPVKLGLVASLGRPGGNVTGVNFFSSELSAKRLGFLRELVPGAARVAVLVNPIDVVITSATVRDLEAAARVLGLEISVLKATNSHEIDVAFATLLRDRCDALFVSSAAFSTAGASNWST